MKLGIVSDLHCNIAGLNRALELMGPVDDLLCLGDSIFEYRFSNEVVATLRDSGFHTIKGNHEEVFLGPLGERARSREGIDPERLQWLDDRPWRLELQYGDKKVLMVHSTAWEPYGEYVYPHSPSLARFGEEDADFVLFGHTHQQLAERFGRVLVINPGSTGDGRDPRNDRQLSCAVLDTESAEVTATLSVEANSGCPDTTST